MLYGNEGQGGKKVSATGLCIISMKYYTHKETNRETDRIADESKGKTA